MFFALIPEELSFRRGDGYGFEIASLAHDGVISYRSVSQNTLFGNARLSYQFEEVSSSQARAIRAGRDSSYATRPHDFGRLRTNLY